MAKSHPLKQGVSWHLLQEFKCEICGMQSYWGRRAFERHFKEWRHQNGMRQLGIPNNKNFFEVTLIKDALELWAAIKVRSYCLQPVDTVP
jgi:splicing factor 3A subunit 3